MAISKYFRQRTADDQLDVARILFEGLSQTDDRIVLSFEGKAIPLGELRARVACAQAALERSGVKPGQRVAVILNNSVDHIAIIYALILSGVVWIPINVRLRGEGLSYVIGHSRPDLLIFGGEFEETVAGLTVAAVAIEALLSGTASPERNVLTCKTDIRPADPLSIIYTSGTTGAAKGVVFTHRMLRVASEAALIVANIRAGDRAFLWEPLCHIGGAQMLMTPFLADAQLHVVPRFSSSQFWTQWREAEATHLHYLGGILDVLMQLPAESTPPTPSIEVAWGAGVTAQAWNPIRERFGCAIRECYGMTECSSFATLNSSGTPGSIGVPLPWIELELLDEGGRSVPKGELGEIVLSSDIEGVFFPEYLDNQEATQNALRGGRLHTGDLARQLENGEYVFVGRRTDSMRVRGENVSAWEVERVFLGHPAIKAAAAIGVPATIGEQDIFVYVQFKPGQSLDWRELVEWAIPRLATFQLPRYYAAVEAFELTPSERIRKHLLSKNTGDAWDRTITANDRREAPHVASV